MKKSALLFLMTLIIIIYRGYTGLAKRDSEKSFVSQPVSVYEKVAFTNNLHVPARVFIYAYKGNESTVKELYHIIDLINSSESLLADDSVDREIHLTVFMDEQEDNTEMKIVINDIIAGKRRSISHAGYPINMGDPTLSVIYTKKEESIWLQDLLEFGIVHLPGGKIIPAIFDLKYERDNTPSEIIKDLSELFSLNLVELNGLGAENSFSGDSGGNIETTPDGIVYVGSSMTVELRKDLSAKTKQEILVLPTEWLYVGHVDEYLFFMPADNDCGYSAFYADPVEALNMIVKDLTWKYPHRNAVKESMEYFMKKKILKNYYTFSEFDLKKPIRKKGNTIEKRNGKYTDWFVLQNLNAYAEIQKGISIIKKSQSCGSPFIPLPVIFQEPNDETYYTTDGVVMKNPFTNALVLRDHVIIPKGHFSSIAIGRLKSPYKNNVHVINARPYEEQFGSIHCGTNVLRDSRYVVKVRKKARAGTGSRKQREYPGRV